MLLRSYCNRSSRYMYHPLSSSAIILPWQRSSYHVRGLSTQGNGNKRQEHQKQDKQSSSLSGTPTWREQLRALRRNGTLEIAVGLTLLGLLAADQLLQYRQEKERERLVDWLAEENRQDRLEFLQEHHDKPVLFECTVRQDPQLDGSLTLNNLVVGDVVQILEEKVGPGNMYNLCRHKHQVGWFPTFCLEKIE